MKTDLIKNIISKHTPPFFVYDAEEISSQFSKLSSALGDDVDVFYSFKANPNLGVCQILQKLEAGAEVCSYYELLLAERAGYKASKIIVVGPYKEYELLKMSLKLGVYAIVCESWYEYSRIQNIAKELKVKAKILLRINPKNPFNNSTLKMGGTSSQFGIDEEDLFDNFPKINKEHVDVIGIHVYMGTRILNYNSIISNVKTIFSIFDRLQSLCNNSLTCVDFGGGFGVDYFPQHEEKPLDINSLSHELFPIIKKFKSQYNIDKIIAESGRYLTASSGLFLTKVVDIKKSQGKKYAIVNGGRNCCFAPSSTSILNKNFPISVFESQNNKTKEKYQICGPLCTPEDLLAKNIMLPKLDLGDLIVVHMVGAYGLTFSPLMFLSHRIPSEILVYKDNIFLIRDGKKLNQLYIQQSSIAL